MQRVAFYRRRFGLLASLASAFLCLSPVALGANVVWSNNAGAGDNNWNTATNWVGGSVPGTGDVAVFDGVGCR